MGKPVIVDAIRTPIGRFMGGLSSFTAPQLGAKVIKSVIERNKLDAEAIDEVIMGCVLQAGLGQNPARQAAIHGGVSPSVGAVTVNKVCGSGMKAIMLAAQAIKAGDGDTYIVGGMESMSNAPHLLPNMRAGQKLGHAKAIDAMISDGLWDCFNDFHMGNTAEMVHEKYNVSREAQDQFAMESQKKAAAAIESGAFKGEIIPVSIPQRKGDPIVMDTDEGPRADTSMDALGKLRPVFKKDGTVTAGNASTINDGASALLVMSEEKAKELGLNVLATIDAYAIGGLEPEWVMMTPVAAVGNLLGRTGESIDDFDLIEFNEAFAAQGVALTNELKVDPSKLNVNGGAIALGHPIGCSGARIVTTLIYALKARGKRRGLASLCMGGGNGLAMTITVS